MFVVVNNVSAIDSKDHVGLYFNSDVAKVFEEYECCASIQKGLG